LVKLTFSQLLETSLDPDLYLTNLCNE